LYAPERGRVFVVESRNVLSRHDDVSGSRKRWAPSSVATIAIAFM
jgi:hypothetical protein